MFKPGIAIWLILFCAGGAIAKEACLFCHTDSSCTIVFNATAHAKKNVTCSDCHIDRSRSSAALFWRSIWSTLTFSYKNAHSADRPTSGTCISCHQAVAKFNDVAEAALPEKLKTIGLVIAHDKHMKLMDSCKTCHTRGSFLKNKVLDRLPRHDPMGCISCHDNIAHVKPEKYATPIPTEKGCAVCHSAANKCPSMKKISDIKDKNRCTECHPNQYSF